MNAYSALLISTLFLLSSCQAESSLKDQEVIINTTQVANVSNDGNKEFPFLAQPFRTSELSFRVGGLIHQFDVYAGNRYQQGELIAGLDARDFRIRCERAEAIYQQAKAEFERIEVLYQKENIAASSYEKAKAEFTSAKTAFETAQNEWSDTRLVAPFNGYIGEVYMEKYQDIKATQPIVSLIDIDQLKIEIYVTQDIAHTMQPSDSIQLYFDAQPNQRYTACVMEVSKGTTRNNLSYLLTALLPNKEGKLLAGMSGKALFHIPQTALNTHVSIPQTTLCHRPTIGNYVWVVLSGSKRVTLRKITIDRLLSNGQMEIAEGLQIGETVATSSLRFLSEGTKVQTTKKGNK